MATDSHLSRLVFVTQELHPETAGGAGVLIDALARRLAGIRPVTVLLCTPQELEGPPRPGVEVRHIPVPESGFLGRSEAVARAIADQVEPGERVEISDFEGLGYLTLAHRIDLGLDRSLLTVRFHGPYDLLADAMDARPEDWDVPAAMEQEAYRMADQVLVPVAAHTETLVTRYQLDPARVRLATPPISELDRPADEPGEKPVFVVLGRLGEMKGSHDMVAAALHLLEGGTDIEIRFVGGDGWSPTTASSMRERLEALIPDEHRHAFVFTGPTPRSKLADMLVDATAVVVPSRFESFCLAAHEARRAGLPVVVPDLAAFTGTFDESTGALVYDGSVDDLARQMARLTENPELRGRLADAPPPPLGDPQEAYLTDAEPRHPRSQAGLATAAAKRLEELWNEKKQRERPSLLQQLYRRLPEGVADLLRRAPQGVKDRAKSRASWSEELLRRHHEDVKRGIQTRLAAVEERIAAGEFPAVAQPDVTVVIPVHDDVTYLDETLASVYEQTHDSWEIVVVDDGSTTPEAGSYLSGLDRPRLTVIHQENRGLPDARNAGMKAARGRFFVPLDSDDQLEPEFLSTMIAALDPHPEAAYAHCYARLHHDVEAIWLTRPFNPYWQLLGNGIVGCVLLRREAWEDVGGYDETMTLGNEDWELWLRLMKRRWGQVQVPRVLFRYRKHGISMSVRTEARFEEGRRMVRDRHPDLYDPARMRRLKSRWYPLVTAVSTNEERPDPEVEIVEDLSSLATTWGKYVVDVRGMEPFPLELVMKLADALEGEPAAGRAVTTGLPPVVMRRRWSLHDPEGPNGSVVVDQVATGPEVEIPGHVPRLGWSVPEQLAGSEVPVQRQPPEEAGPMPDPSRW